MAAAPGDAQPKNAVLEGIKSFISGGFGGMCLVVAGQPFDMVKVRLQAQRVVAGQAPEFSGPIDAARKIIAKDGVAGLYRGMTAPLAGVTPIFAVCFAAYEFGKDFQVKSYGLKDQSELSLAQIAMAGAFSAVPTTAIMAPGERIKIVLQTETNNPKIKGVGDAFRHIMSQGGARSLFRGSMATILRDGTGSMAYFGVYEYIKRTLSPADKPGTLSPTAVILGGGFAGVCNWLVAIPFDTVKTRIQTATTNRGFVEVSKELMREEGGIGALYKGTTPALVRAFPANAATFLGVELSRKFLDGLF